MNGDWSHRTRWCPPEWGMMANYDIFARIQIFIVNNACKWGTLTDPIYGIREMEDVPYLCLLEKSYVDAKGTMRQRGEPHRLGCLLERGYYRNIWIIAQLTDAKAHFNTQITWTIEFSRCTQFHHHSTEHINIQFHRQRGSFPEKCLFSSTKALTRSHFGHLNAKMIKYVRSCLDTKHL